MTLIAWPLWTVKVVELIIHASKFSVILSLKSSRVVYNLCYGTLIASLKQMSLSTPYMPNQSLRPPSLMLSLMWRVSHCHLRLHLAVLPCISEPLVSTSYSLPSSSPYTLELYLGLISSSLVQSSVGLLWRSSQLRLTPSRLVLMIPSSPQCRATVRANPPRGIFQELCLLTLPSVHLSVQTEMMLGRRAPASAALRDLRLPALW
ncbi:hypothetical protein R3P38DRAFT_3274509 [Favolaschia claudopus]|uniref:Uncharacterized protein n=1 Tax=Favolaschia claudopus TaxID=2862362 RepID=A0AAW0AZM3_9AGAR